MIHYTDYRIVRTQNKAGDTVLREDCAIACGDERDGVEICCTLADVTCPDCIQSPAYIRDSAIVAGRDPLLLWAFNRRGI